MISLDPDQFKKLTLDTEEYLLEYGDTEHPKRKGESDFLKRRKKIPQKIYPKRVFRERIDKSSLFLYNEFRISI
jgi:hypothetical protein